MLRLGFHCVVSCYQVYVLYCLSQLKLEGSDDPMLKNLAKMNLRFLTNWNFFAQTVFFFASLLLDVLRFTKPSPKVGEKLQRVSSYFLFSILIPLTFLVAIFFWSVFLYNRELVFPKVLDKVLPLWLNHAIHSMIVVNLLIEIFLVHHVLPKTSISITVLLGFMSVYLYVLVNTYLTQGIWIYPIFDKLNWPFRIVTFVICISLEALLLLAARKVNKMIWGQSKPNGDLLLG